MSGGWIKLYFLSVLFLNLIFLPLYSLKLLLVEIPCGLVLILLGRPVEWSVIWDQLRDVVSYYNPVSPLRNLWGVASEQGISKLQEEGGMGRS